MRLTAHPSTPIRIGRAMHHHRRFWTGGRPILPRSLQRPVPITDGNRSENSNKIGAAVDLMARVFKDIERPSCERLCDAPAHTRAVARIGGG
jgi:hypothetical protein